MHIVSFCALALFLAAGDAPAKVKKNSAASAQTEDNADENAQLAKPFGGKVWSVGGELPGAAGERLSRWLSSHTPQDTIAREPAVAQQDGPWKLGVLAVFKKPAVPGAMTLQFYEKGDKAVVDVASVEGSGGYVWQGVHELSPDLGFNKGRTYEVKIGQILKGKFVPYAAGTFTLK